MAIGRNDPCPCGSGKKYKKCCLASESQGQVADFEYRRLRDIEAGLIPKLMRQAAEVFGAEAFEAAWEEFNDYQPPHDFDPESPMNQAFMPWFLFNWTERDADETIKPGAPVDVTVAETFIRTKDRRLSADEKMILTAANRCPFSLCEITEVRPGDGMKLRDLLRNEAFDVIERSASKVLKRGEIIYCATMHLANRFTNIATSPIALPPINKRNVLELRDAIAVDARGEPISSKHLLEFEFDIRGVYLDIVKQLFNPQPQVHNTDGDPMIPQKVVFDIGSSHEAFAKLQDLAEGATREDLMRDAKAKDGKVIEIEVPWLGGKPEARKRLAGPVLLGRLFIKGNRLTAEVNSNDRADRIRMPNCMQIDPGCCIGVTPERSREATALVCLHELG